MAKSIASQKVSARTIGKAKTFVKNSSGGRVMSMASIITDAKLDNRQLAKGVKRKAHGPKLKRLAKAKKQLLAQHKESVPQTEVIENITIK